MKTKLLTAAVFTVFALLSNMVFSQLNGFPLLPSGDTEDYMKYIRNAVNVDGENYFTGYLSLSAYKNYNTNVMYDPGIPLQKLQLRGGNILLYGTHLSPNINPTSKNGAILFSDIISLQYPHGKWGIEYDDQYSPGGLNMFMPVSSLTDTRINFNLFLGNDGHVGIGTGAPQAKLQVTDGDIFIENIDRGIIMKSPDGKCWRGTLNNQGLLVFTELPDCIITDSKTPEPVNTASVYPNPAGDKLNIKPGKFASHQAEVTVISATGTIEMKESLSAAQSACIDIQNLKPGNYILQITNGKELESVKFIKQ